MIQRNSVWSVPSGCRAGAGTPTRPTPTSRTSPSAADATALAGHRPGDGRPTGPVLFTPPTAGGVTAGRETPVALLEVENLQVTFDTEDGVAPRRARAVVHGRGRTDPRHRRRVRLREERLGPAVVGLTRRARSQRPAPCSTATTARPARREAMRSLRGNEIGMVFQDPLTSLDPLHTVGRQIERASARTPDRERARPASARSTCSGRSASRSRSGASTSTPTSSPAACASGR